MANLLLALTSAGLLVLIFPRFNLSFLAPIALTPLLLAAGREPFAWRRLLWGEIAGIAYWAGVCYWIQFVLVHHGGMSTAGSCVVFFLFCLVKGLHMAVFMFLAGPLIQRSFGVPAVAALWAGLERTHAPLGFPWLMLGNAGIDMDLPMRLAPITGVYGLSFLFALISATLAAILLGKRREQIVWLLPLPALILLPNLPPPSAGERQAVILQPNIDPEQDWRGETVARLCDRFVYRSLVAAWQASERKPELIVWPEVPAPFYYFSDPVFRGAINSLARMAESPVLAGTVAFTSDGAPLNSAVYVSPNGEVLARYDKILLVPFGEYVPRHLGFVQRITREAGDFVPGSQIVVVRLNGHHVGAFICYEAAFPHLVRQFALAGAEVFFNLSNDGYFGRSAARQQHLLLARMRAAENRRWLIRATNNGITGAIDPAGRLLEMFPEYEEMAARLRFSWVSETTWYARWGDWFAWSSLGVALALALWTWLPRYRPEMPPPAANAQSR